jgi:hypothetical protein
MEVGRLGAGFARRGHEVDRDVGLAGKATMVRPPSQTKRLAGVTALERRRDRGAVDIGQHRVESRPCDRAPRSAALAALIPSGIARAWSSLAPFPRSRHRRLVKALKMGPQPLPRQRVRASRHPGEDVPARAMGTSLFHLAVADCPPRVLADPRSEG